MFLVMICLALGRWALRMPAGKGFTFKAGRLHILIHGQHPIRQRDEDQLADGAGLLLRVALKPSQIAL